MIVDVKKRKVRRVGNSSVITLSKEFLESIGVTDNDMVFVDENKLKDNIVKVDSNEENNELDMLISKSLQKYGNLYSELVEK